MRDVDADPELPPMVGELYRDVLAQRAIATLDDYAPEAPVSRSAGRAISEQQPGAECAGGDCGKI